MQNVPTTLTTKDQVSRHGDYERVIESIKSSLREGLKKAGQLVEASGEKMEESGTKRLSSMITNDLVTRIERLGD